MKPRGPKVFIGYAAGGCVAFGFVKGLLAAVGNSEMGQGAGFADGALAAAYYFPLCWAIMWGLRGVSAKALAQT